MDKDWNRRTFLCGSVAGAALPPFAAAEPAAADGVLLPQEPPNGPGGLHVGRTTVEYARTLLGTDVAEPRLSRELTADGRGARRSAYCVRGAASPHGGDAGEDRKPVWDSGKVASDRSIGVPYGGPPLRPRTHYHRQVRVWDHRDRPSPWSPAGWWETALTDRQGRARWIGADPVPEPSGFGGAPWI